MKHKNPIRGFNAAFASLLVSFSLPVLGQIQVVVPNDIIQSDAANAAAEGWRIVSVGNSQMGLVPVADFSIPANFGPHSVRGTRPGGPGLNRSFVGYYEAGHTLASVEEISWNRFSEPSAGTDSYLNIFISNGAEVATVVYHPTVIVGSWNEFTYNSSVPMNQLVLRYNGNIMNISYAELIANFGTWQIYNHPNTIALNFTGNYLGGIVLVNGSSSPSQAQTHTYDGVTVDFAGSEGKFFDFVAETIEPPAGCSAVEVLAYAPTKRNDGSALLPTRTIAANALGVPQNSDVAVAENALNFVALGFGGSITLRLSGPVANTNGTDPDLRIVETTYGSASQNCVRYPERVQVFVSQDGCNWIYTGTGCQDVNVDFGPLNWAEFVKLVDISPIDGVYDNQIADGYDVDGVICLSGPAVNPVMQDLGNLYAMGYSDFNQGLRKNNTAVVPPRSNPNKALFAPEGTNTINFVALGFGGSIILKLGYVVFDKPGNDLRIVETSFGNPVCGSYPERATFEVSLDKMVWVNLGEFCLDEDLDFATGGATAVQYIRITDHSTRANFNNAADGYDVDGIIVLQPGCPVTGGSNAKIEDNIWTADETVSFSVSPNPFNSIVKLDVASGDDAEQMIIRVMNVAGQLVYTSNVNVASNSATTHTMDLSSLTQGIYFVSVESNSTKEVFKLVKQ